MSIFLLALLSVLVLPAAASAQRCSGDDVAAVDQYCERLPSAEGPAAGSPRQPALRTALPDAERRALWQAGPAGRALLSMPMGAQLHGRDLTVRPMPGATDAVAGWLADHARAEGDSLTQTGSTAWHGERLSQLFRWLLLMTTVGLVGTAWVRRGS